MSTTTEATPTGVADTAGGAAVAKDPYIYGSDETVLLDLRELRALEAADKAAKDAGLEEYEGSHRRGVALSQSATLSRQDEASLLYAHGGTAIPLDRVREVCHDLRQPVAAILMLASAAEMRPDVPERVREVLQEIMTQTEDISSTVRQFLDDAKQGVDGLGDPVPSNVAGMSAEAVERWRATFTGRLDYAAADDPLHVTVDPVLYKRALGNVLSNATRAAGNGGQVQVTVRRFLTDCGERAVIEVDDSGPGFGNIPSGHGLGLAVVRRTIEAAGGSVEFAEGPLGGALVRLVLPVTTAKQLSAHDELAATFHGEISLADLADEMEASGFHTALVSEGHAFSTRMSALPEQVAITDGNARPTSLEEALRDATYATPVWARGLAAEEIAAAPQSPAITASTEHPTEPEPLRITGQDGVAAIQLPSRANLTDPPRIPATALRPVASVQLSLMPGGAF